MLLEQQESCPGLQELRQETVARRWGAVTAACGDVCANWKVYVILKSSPSLDVSSFSRVWVIYFSESIFSSFFGWPCFKSF